MTGELPAGWRWATVGELAERVDFGSSAKTSDDADGVPVLRMGNIVGGRLRLEGLKYLPKKHSQFPELFLEPGDVLFNRTNSPELVGKSAVYGGQPSPCSFASYLLRVRLRGLHPQLFAWYVNSDAGRAWVASVVSQQVGQANVNSTKLRAFRVPVPPAAVQGRMVAKLDALLAQTRATREQLEAVPDLLEKYRQSVLAAAFRGDLTADWRKKNPRVESASKLLERIRVERRNGWEAAELSKLKAKGKVPKDDKWKSKYVEPAPVDTAGLPDLPPTWCWAAIEELCPFDGPAVYGIIQPGEHVEGGVPYIRPVDISDEGTVVLAELKRTSEEISADYERSRLRAGDVVLSIVGTIGKVFAVPAEFEGANITQSSIRIRPPAGISTAFTKLVLQSPVLRRQYERFRFGNAVQRLNVEHVRRLAFPVAPPDEVEAIVALTEQRLAGADLVGRSLEPGRMASLERALLAKAFRGELET